MSYENDLGIFDVLHSKHSRLWSSKHVTEGTTDAAVCYIMTRRLYNTQEIRWSFQTLYLARSILIKSYSCYLDWQNSVPSCNLTTSPLFYKCCTTLPRGFFPCSYKRSFFHKLRSTRPQCDSLSPVLIAVHLGAPSGKSAAYSSQGLDDMPF